MAAALRLLLRQHAAAPPSPMLRSLFPAPYSKGELRCCRTVPSTMTDSTKSLPDKLRHLKDGKKSLQDMEKNLEEHEEMIRKALHDRKVANDLFSKRLDDRQKLLAKISNVPDDYVETHDCHDVLTKINSMQDDLAKVEKMRVDYDKDWDIQEAKARVFDEQMEMLCKKREDYITAFRRYHELERSTMEQEENQEKDEPRCCETVPSAMTDSTKSLLGKLKDLKDSKKALQDMEKDIEEHVEMIRKALMTGEPHSCKTVPSTMNDSTKSLLDKLKDLMDSKKSLQGMKKNIEEHMEMIRKVNHDGAVARDLLSKKLDDRRELIAKIKSMRDDYEKTRNMQYGLAKLLDMEHDLAKAENMVVDFDKDCAILEANNCLGAEEIEMLRKEVDDYGAALRRHHELERSTMEQVEKVKKVAKVATRIYDSDVLINTLGSSINIHISVKVLK
ncbi:hypothetical protein ACQ4PT_054097 [Festuca glaucescens]